MRLLPKRRKPTLRDRAEGLADRVKPPSDLLDRLSPSPQTMKRVKNLSEEAERVAKGAVARSKPAFEEARRQAERAGPLVDRARKEAEARTKDARKELDKRTKGVRKDLDKRTKGARKEAKRRTEAARKRIDPAVEGVRSRLPGREPSRLERAKTPLLVAGAAAVGGAAVYFLDPVQGKARRARAKDRTASALRKTGRTAGKAATRLKNRAQGAAHEAVPSAEEPEFTEPTLAHKVESEVLGDPEFPKGRVNVSAENGTIVLKGDLDDAEQVHRLEEAVRRVDGVHDVENRISTES